MHRNNIHRRSSKLITTLLTLAMMACLTQATVIGVSPAKLEYDGIKRGQEFTSNLSASSTDEKIDCEILTSGEIAEWITTPEQTITLEPGKIRPFQITVKVPESIPNKEYTGYLRVRTKATQKTGQNNILNVGAGISIPVKIKVSGNEGTWFRVLTVQVSNPQQKEPVRTQIIIKNNAAVPVKPRINLELMDYERQNIYSTYSAATQEIPPDSRQTIERYLPTTDLNPGIYVIHAIIDVEGEEVWNSNESFHIISIGDESKKVNIDGLLAHALITNANLTMGEKITIKGDFKNTGEVPVYAKLMAEIIKDKQTINTLQGQEIHYNAGEAKGMTLDYEPPQPGEYTINIWVEYMGLRTEIRQTTAKVWAYTQPLIDLNFNFYLITLPVILLSIMWIAIYYRKYYFS